MAPDSWQSLSLQHFYYFCKVVELGTMSKAAEVLYVSQPLLSQKISQLEAALEVPLFNRKNKTLQLTEAGQQFLLKSYEIIIQVETAFESVKNNFGDINDKPLRIGLSESKELSSVNYTLTKLNEAIPYSTFEVEIGIHHNIFTKLLNDELDLCMLLDTEKYSQHKRINYRNLFELSLNCIVSADSPLASKGCLRWEDIDGYICCWPTAFKYTALTKDLYRLISSKKVNIQWEYHDVDHVTTRRYLSFDKRITFSFTPTLDDSTLKLFKLGDISYPYIILWKKDDADLLDKSIEQIVKAFEKQ
ncbi:LysR family transcriptional regulator [Tyzzerella sp. OttesenSCG-928-J15]|nr:LysR family transcriptional regulator [Tyzzerella sp. OttesenSCG-928-J15]